MAVSRDEWLAMWRIPEAQADRAWAEKQAFDARHTTSAAIISDKIDPCLSHADGKVYDSKSALYRTYRPDGNPQGVSYECVGERVAEPFKKEKGDPGKRRDAIERSFQQMGFGA